MLFLKFDKSLSIHFFTSFSMGLEFEKLTFTVSAKIGFDPPSSKIFSIFTPFSRSLIRAFNLATSASISLLRLFTISSILYYDLMSEVIAWEVSRIDGETISSSLW